MNLVPKAIPIQNNVTAALTATLLLFLSCDQGVTPPLPSSSLLENLVITQTYYDSVRVQNGTNFIVPFQNIDKISLGEKTDSGYVELASVKPSYTPLAQGYLATFKIEAQFDRSRSLLQLVVRYYFFDEGLIFDVMREISPLQYPYPSAEIFVTSSIHIDTHGNSFQDIDKVGNKFYYHPTGPYGLFEYDLDVLELKEVVRLTGGDHIAVEESLAFVDNSHRTVDQYDFVTDSVTPSLIRFSSPTNIRGLETYNGNLYVMTDSSKDNLRRYSYDGTLLEVMDYPNPSAFITIDKGILYSYSSVNSDQLTRFKLSSRTFLTTIHVPALEGQGIKIAEGYLYYCDYNRRLVGRVPIEDIE